MEAFREEGLAVGLYYSVWDWFHDDCPVDEYHPMRKDEVFKAKERDFEKYVTYMHGQVRELLTNYGKIDILWFDAGRYENAKTIEMSEMIYSLQPDIMIMHQSTK